MTKKWNPAVYECKSCGSEVWSKFPGDWVPCACFENKEGNGGGYVDQTEHYIRIGGALVYKRQLNEQ